MSRAKPNVLKCAAGLFFQSVDGRTVGLLGLLVTLCAQKQFWIVFHNDLEETNDQITKMFQ